ncbi:MAG: hypothetical protein HZB13_06765 [Acidobacteria bacterium]|nr:hypothetical protein [Acidobacteriota bacterium]
MFCALLIFGLLDGSIAAAPRSDEAAAAMAAPADSPQDREADAILKRCLQSSRKGVIRGVTMVAHFAGRIPKLQKTATVDASRHISREGAVEYTVTERNGDSTVQKELIFRFMGRESESAGKDNSKAAVNEANYKFKYKGKREKDDRMAYVFEISPKKKREGLFKGEIWVDEESCLTVREAGRFVKSPSVFLKKVEFTREYTIRDGVAVPKMMQVNSETRFWGVAELNIQYGELTFEDPRSINGNGL